MIDIGILGLDTSHAESFPEIIQATRPETVLDSERSVAEFSISAVYDDETIRDQEYVEHYCSTYDAERFRSVESMVGAVDMAMVLSVDWERHVPLATPFLEAGVPTFIDKPIVGSYDDLQMLERAAQKAPVLGGSAVPFHPAFAEFSREASGRTTHVVGYNDYFYYRVHATDTLRYVATADWESVEPVSDIDPSVVEVTFENGTWGTLRFDGPTEEPAFGAIDVADRVRTASVPATSDSLAEMYQPFLREFLSLWGAGPDAQTGRLLDTAALSLAIETALETGDVVESGDERLRSNAIPSESFVSEYEPYY